MTRHCAFALSLLVSVGGCSAELPEQTVFDEKLEALDRARQVGDTVEARAEELGRKLGHEDPDDDEAK